MMQKMFFLLFFGPFPTVTFEPHEFRQVISAGVALAVSTAIGFVFSPSKGDPGGALGGSKKGARKRGKGTAKRVKSIV